MRRRDVTEVLRLSLRLVVEVEKDVEREEKKDLVEVEKAAMGSFWEVGGWLVSGREGGR